MPSIAAADRRQIIIEQPEGYEVLNYAENQYGDEDWLAD